MDFNRQATYKAIQCYFCSIVILRKTRRSCRSVLKLGLRAQEIALLQIKEVAQLNSAGTDFKLLEVMSLPAAYTKGADAMGRSKSKYQRKSACSNIASFNNVAKQIEALAKSGASIDPH